MTAISNNNVAQAIYLYWKEEKKPEQFIPKVVQFLARKRLLSKTSSILERLDKIINEHEGRVIAKISSKNKLNEKVRQELKRVLTKRYAVKEVVLDENLNEKLLGGFKVEAGDEVIDLTVKNKIYKLEKYLTRNI